MTPPMTDDLVGRLRRLLADAERQRQQALDHLPGDTKFMMLTNASHAERHVLAQVPLLFARIEALEGENRKLREVLGEVGMAFSDWDPDQQYASSALAGVSATARAALAKDKSDG